MAQRARGNLLTCGLRVLPTHPETPEMSQSTMSPNLLQPLKVITEFRVHTVGQYLIVLSIDDILLPVQEPSRNFELGGVLNDGNKTFKLVRVEFSSTIKSSMKSIAATEKVPYRLLRSTSAFLHTRLE